MRLEPHDVVVIEVARRFDAAGCTEAATLLRQTPTLYGTARELCFNELGTFPSALAPVLLRLRARETWNAAQALLRLDGRELDPWVFIRELALAQGVEVEPLPRASAPPPPAEPAQDLRPEALAALARVAHLEALLDKLAPRWRKSPAEEAAAFNARAPIGTRVRYWRGVKHGEPSGEGTVRHPAQVMSDHASVWITGCSGSISLSHVEVVS
jgi:hypothetical protein